MIFDFILQSFYQRIEEKLSIISDEKHDLEDILKHANSEYPGDKNVLRLYEKYVELFKETVSLDQEEVHVDDFSQEDHEKNEGGPKKDSDGGEKGDGGVKGDGDEKGDGGEKGDGEKGDAQDEEIIEVGSFTQWLEENYDVVGDVIDIISEVYYDVLYLS